MFIEKLDFADLDFRSSGRPFGDTIELEALLILDREDRLY